MNFIVSKKINYVRFAVFVANAIMVYVYWLAFGVLSDWDHALWCGQEKGLSLFLLLVKFFYVCELGIFAVSMLKGKLNKLVAYCCFNWFILAMGWFTCVGVVFLYGRKSQVLLEFLRRLFI